MSALRRWGTVGVAAAVVLVLDQITKAWAIDRLKDQPPIDVVWTLRLTYAQNTGMAFSKGSGAGRLIAVVVVAIVVALLLLARRLTSRWGLVLVGVVVGGAFGNLVDRLFRADGGFLTGAVVDWIDLQWWPVFNVADAAVVVGGLSIALMLVLEPDPGRRDPDVGAAAGSGDGGAAPPDEET